MTSFADAFAQADQRPGNPCSFADLRAKMSKKDLEQLDAAMAQPHTKVPHARIARALGLVTGTKVDADIIGRHRRGDCRKCGA